MMQAPSSATPDRSRLVQLLTQLSKAKVSTAEHNLAEQLGRLIDLSDSITLAEALAQLPKHAGEQTVDEAQAVQADILSSRKRMIGTITGSFAVGISSSRIKAPSARATVTPEALQTFEPYHRFYAMHQAEMEANVQGLRARVRKAVSGFSTELHQLAELDKTLGDSLEAYNRKLLAVSPKLLEHRFEQLLQQHQANDKTSNKPSIEEWLAPNGWLTQLYQDLHDLLLAELDVRLQPVIGLLEALNEQVNTTQ